MPVRSSLLLLVLISVVACIVLRIHVLVWFLNEIVGFGVSDLLHELLSVLLLPIRVVAIVIELVVKMILHFSFSDLLFSFSSLPLPLLQFFCLSYAFLFSFDLFSALFLHPSSRLLFSLPNLLLHPLLFISLHSLGLLSFHLFLLARLFGFLPHPLILFLLFSFLLLFSLQLFLLRSFILFDCVLNGFLLLFFSKLFLLS